MSFFKKTAPDYPLTSQATENLIVTVKSLLATVETLRDAPAYAGAFEIKNPQLLEHGIAILATLLIAIRNPLSSTPSASQPAATMKLPVLTK